MRTYLVTITMPDGSQGRHHGLYQDGFAAVLAAMERFPEAQRVSAQEVA